MVYEREEGCRIKKPGTRTTREINSMVYLLRCKQLGLTLDELDCLSCGMVWDMLTEQSNDGYEYPRLAEQKQFNEFLGG